jgi:ANTAR domain-containing protein
MCSLQQRARRERELLAEQLQPALTSRVPIEQAKGVLAERLSLGTEQGFSRRRRHAHNGNHRLTELARAVVDGSTPTSHEEDISRRSWVIVLIGDKGSAAREFQREMTQVADVSNRDVQSGVPIGSRARLELRGCRDAVEHSV